MYARNNTDEKARLRVKARSLRSSLPDRFRAEVAEKITQQVLDMIRRSDAGTVLMYAATDDEVDTAHLAESLWERGDLIVAFPTVDVEARRIIPRRTVSADDLAAGAYDIMEPRSRCEPVAVETIDLAIVPGLIFDRNGWRLGFGGGYYDRFLPRLERAVTVGLQYHLLLWEELPTADHDVPVDWVITEQTMIDARKGRR